MEKPDRKRLSLLALIALPMAAKDDTPKCPIDDSTMWFTGQTRSERGKLLQKWKCPVGHEVWIVT